MGNVISVFLCCLKFSKGAWHEVRDVNLVMILVCCSSNTKSEWSLQSRDGRQELFYKKYISALAWIVLLAKLGTHCYFLCQFSVFLILFKHVVFFNIHVCRQLNKPGEGVVLFVQNTLGRKRLQGCPRLCLEEVMVGLLCTDEISSHINIKLFVCLMNVKCFNHHDILTATASVPIKGYYHLQASVNCELFFGLFTF